MVAEGPSCSVQAFYPLTPGDVVASTANASSKAACARGLPTAFCASPTCIQHAKRWMEGMDAGSKDGVGKVTARSTSFR
jgi:chitodextrinase